MSTRPGTAQRSRIPLTQQPQRPSTSDGTGGARPQSAHASPHQNARQKKNQHELLVRLNNTIADTYQTPPEGTSEETILQRRAMLLEMKHKLESDYQRTKTEAANAQRERWEKAQRDQLAKEEWLKEHLHTLEEKARRAKEDEDDRRRQKLKSQAYQIQSRTNSCFHHLETQFQSHMATVDESLKAKKEQLAATEARRQRQKQQQLQKILDAEAHAADMIHRKEEADARHQREVEERAAEHRRLAEESLARVAAEKKEKARRTEEKRQLFKFKGGVNKVSAVMLPNHTVKLNVEEMDYAARLEQLNTDAVKREEKVTAVKEMRQAEINQVRAKFKGLARAQEEGLAAEEARRDKDANLVISTIKDKSAYVERMRHERDEALKMYGVRKREDVFAHMKRAASLRAERQNRVRSRVFQRWNNSSDKMVAQLCKTVAEDLGDSPPTAGHANTNSPGAHRPMAPHPQPPA